MKAGEMRTGDRWVHNALFWRKSGEDGEGDVVFREFVTDLLIFVGEALLSAACLGIAAADGNVTFLIFSIVAAVAATLPVRDWVRR
ncbi:MAG TPA: hypothetical protein VEU53_10985 [Stellaceae bacterium]|nr:hypothetical protein [Stellaceae bacterium]